MASYPKIVTTYEGLSLISAATAAGAPLVFTKVMLGDGDLGEQDQRALTDLISPKLELPLSGIEDLGNGQFQITAAASNDGLESGFFAKEVGVYGKYSDDSGEKLIAYTNGGNYADYIPDQSTPIDSQVFKIDVVVGDASEVTIEVQDDTYVLKEELYETIESAIEEHDSSGGAHADIWAAIESSIAEHNTSTEAHADIRAAVESVIEDAVTDVSYSSGTLTVSKGDGTSSTASINPVTSVTKSGTTVTVTRASGSTSTFTVPGGSYGISSYYTSGTTGYVLFSNNFIIQWARPDATNGSNTFTLPHAMANTNYFVGFVEARIGSTASHSTNPFLNAVTTTAVTICLSSTSTTCPYVVMGTAAS